MKRIAINGFGRIGRLVFRIIEESDDLEVVAINDLSTPEELAYLLKYDTNHRQYKKEITYKEDSLFKSSHLQKSHLTFETLSVSCKYFNSKAMDSPEYLNLL